MLHDFLGIKLGACGSVPGFAIHPMHVSGTSSKSDALPSPPCVAKSKTCSSILAYLDEIAGSLNTHQEHGVRDPCTGRSLGASSELHELRPSSGNCQHSSCPRYLYSPRGEQPHETEQDRDLSPSVRRPTRNDSCTAALVGALGSGNEACFLDRQKRNKQGEEYPLVSPPVHTSARKPSPNSHGEEKLAPSHGSCEASTHSLPRKHNIRAIGCNDRSTNAIITSGSRASKNESADKIQETKGRQRWVWDQWDMDGLEDREGDSGRHLENTPYASSTRFTPSCDTTTRHLLAAMTQSRVSARHIGVSTSASSPTSTGGSSLKRSLNIEQREADEHVAPDARQAFENIQATAKSMRDTIKERRSEVLELKTALQRVRASNERRTAKLSERWTSRAAVAAVEREGSAEQQRRFARQLEKDVADMEDKLTGLERQVMRFCDNRERDCVLARAECTRELKKAREAWMAAEKGSLRRLSEKRAGAIKQAAIQALEPQLSELVMSNRAESRARVEELESVFMDAKRQLEREADEKVQAETRDYQAALEAEVQDERRQAEHQLKLLARSNDAEIQEFREAMRRDLEGERVRFEADRKRTREAATKELEAARVAEMERAALTVAGHERELREADEAHRREEDETRRRLAEEMERWQRHVLDAARKEALERDIAKKRAMREKCNEELDVFVSRLEAEDNQAREMARAEAQRVAKASAEERARELTRAQELEVKAMERYLDSARRQTEIEAEAKGLEQEANITRQRIQDESTRLATAEQQVGEGRERWQTRLDRLKKECSAERALARDEVAQLSAKSEAAERGAKHAGAVAEEVSAKVKASLEDEFTQVEAKIALVLERKSKQEEALRNRLRSLEAQSLAREKELSEYRRRTFS